MRTCHLNGLLIIGLFLVSTKPLYAENQQPGTAKLKADAQMVISSISADKAKIEAYYVSVDKLSRLLSRRMRRQLTH